ncbi:MAG: hemolysin family protein [Verrucomicrobiales bacterium]|nr:hemolysin family protein [Verrucomicrobiales bacterium]
MTLLITYILIALGFSFLCSLLEASLLSISSAAVHAADRRGAGWAKKMGVLKADIDKPLSAILTLNTIAHTMGAAGAGAQYAKIYNNVGEAIFAAALTLAILIFTEIIPKTLGARYATFFAPGTAHFLPVLQTMLLPIVWACGLLTKLLTFGRADGKPMHREELLAVAHQGEAEGALKQEEGTIVRNILQLHEVCVEDIMTPRPVIFALPEDTPLAEFTEILADKPFSRVPVYTGSKDHVTGFVLRSDALHARIAGDAGEQTVGALKRPIGMIRENIAADELFRQFINDGHHIALVSDSYGTLVGLVTLEDILETIVGVEIVDEKDEVADLQLHARKLWKQRAGKMGITVEDES